MDANDQFADADDSDQEEIPVRLYDNAYPRNVPTTSIEKTVASSSSYSGAFRDGNQSGLGGGALPRTFVSQQHQQRHPKEVLARPSGTETVRASQPTKNKPAAAADLATARATQKSLASTVQNLASTAQSKEQTSPARKQPHGVNAPKYMAVPASRRPLKKTTKNPKKKTTIQKHPPPQAPPPFAAASVMAQSPPAPRRVRQHRLRRVEKTMVIPDSTVRQQVVRASALVAEELRAGASSWLSLSAADVGQEQQQLHLNQSATALEQYCKDIVLPSLESARGEHNVTFCRTNGNDNTQSRPFIATMLALREVLMLNADAIFGNDATRILASTVDAMDGATATTVDSTTDESEPNELVAVSASEPGIMVRQLQHDKEEEECHKTNILATGIILSAIERLGEPQCSVIMEELIRAINEYDVGGKEFASCLEPADGRSKGILADGTLLGREENVIWKVSYNRVRQRHPLYVKSQKRKVLEQLTQENTGLHKAHDVSEDAMVHRIVLPSPNACHVTMVETVPTHPTPD